MTKLSQISEAEFEVMQIIWEYAPVNTNEAGCQKNITYEKQSRIFVYTPLVKEKED